jgi:4-cresol dehydrogenase (hydroxylating)
LGLRPDGSCVHTGFGRFEAALAAKALAHGVGPSLDGLFIQSNLGIVTQLTHWLTPAPGFHEYFSFAINTPQGLIPLVDALQAIKRECFIETGFGLYNAYKILTYTCQYPKRLAQSRRMRLEDLSAEELSPLRGGVWFGEGAITAPNEEMGLMKRRLLRHMLSDHVDRLEFKGPGADNPLVGASPLATGLSGVYWRKESPPPEDPHPDKDRCGVIWLCPVSDVFIISL